MVRLFHQRKLGREEIAHIHMSEESDNREWISNWLRQEPSGVKLLMMSTEELSLDPLQVTPGPREPWMAEIGGTEVHEMMDTSRPMELHDTDFVPFPFPRRNGLASSQSVTSQYLTRSTVSCVGYTPPPNQESTVTPLTSTTSRLPSLHLESSGFYIESLNNYGKPY